MEKKERLAEERDFEAASRLKTDDNILIGGFLDICDFYFCYALKFSNLLGLKLRY